MIQHEAQKTPAGCCFAMAAVATLGVVWFVKDIKNSMDSDFRLDVKQWQQGGVMLGARPIGPFIAMNDLIKSLAGPPTIKDDSFKKNVKVAEWGNGVVAAAFIDSSGISNVPMTILCRRPFQGTLFGVHTTDDMQTMRSILRAQFPTMQDVNDVSSVLDLGDGSNIAVEKLDDNFSFTLRTDGMALVNSPYTVEIK